MAPPLAKDEAMPRTEEYFEKALAMDAELIHEMKDEIAKLKSKVNRLEQKLASKKTIIKVLNETNAKTAELKRIKCKGVGDNDGFFEL